MFIRAYLGLTDPNKDHFNVIHRRKKKNSFVFTKVNDRRLCQEVCLKISPKFISAPECSHGQAFASRVAWGFQPVTVPDI